MDFKQELLQKFNQWVNTLPVPISRTQAKDYAKYFIANHIDIAMVDSRGTIYDIFEDMYTYACMQKLVQTGQLNAADTMRVDNLKTLSEAVVLAVEHDGFDSIKYNPIANWGMDIMKMHGVKPA